jgi:hypothetical protein
MAKSPQQPEIEKLLCAQCAQTTNHTLLSTYQTNWFHDESGFSGGANHDFLKCNGCESATLRITSWYSEDPGDTVTIYPPRGTQEAIRKPKEFEEIVYGNALDSVYRQTVSAFNQQLLTLAGAGVRLIIEGVCNDRGIKDGPVADGKGSTKRKDNLEGRINGLAEKGYISTHQADTLHQLRFLGNDAAHSLDQPSVKIVGMALDIVEHLLEQVYDQPGKAKAIAARKRPKK